MSPLKISLLLRCYCQPVPNQDLPREQAFASSMVQAVEDFRAEGILKDFVSPGVLVDVHLGQSPVQLLTAKGQRLALCIIAAAEYFYREET